MSSIAERCYCGDPWCKRCFPNSPDGECSECGGAIYDGEEHECESEDEEQETPEEEDSAQGEED